MNEVVPVVAYRSNDRSAACAADVGPRRSHAAVRAPPASRDRTATRLPRVRVVISVTSSQPQFVALGGSIRMYVMGPVIVTPHEVIWYSAWLWLMM